MFLFFNVFCATRSSVGNWMLYCQRRQRSGRSATLEKLNKFDIQHVFGLKFLPVSVDKITLTQMVGYLYLF